MKSSTPGGLLGYSIAAGLLLKLACGCAGGGAAPAGAGGAEPAGANSPARLPLQALMQTRIDPAADTLWDAVAFVASERGEEDRRPRTEAEWAQVRQSAQALIEAASDLGMPGQWVAAAARPSPGLSGEPGEIDAPALQRRIDADPTAFARRAQALGSAAQKALAAIDAKDADGLMNAGGLIDAACETCHVLYWYPRQLAPGRH